MDITELLSFCKKNNASDLHLSAGNQPIIRVYGALKKLKGDPLTSEQIKSIIYALMSKEQREYFEKEKDIDFAVTFGEKSRFRINAFMNRAGVSAAIRLVPVEIPSFMDLDLPPVFEDLCQLNQGLVILTGPSGCGKTTTMAAMVDYINKNMDKHIIGIEDPVEFIHASQKSLINQREIGSDTKGFDIALKAALREDPDVIMIGEMRDYETISLALTAAETGHLVISTMHSVSAAKAIHRIIDVFPQEDKQVVRSMLSNGLAGVVAQRLLRREDENGQIAAFEILRGTDAARNLIKEDRIGQLNSLMGTSAQDGMILMDDAIADLKAHGIAA